MKIDYQVIPFAEMRYLTAGDYWWQGDILFIRVAQLGDSRYEYLIYHHEFTEATLVWAVGKADLSTEFDMPYELARKLGQAAPCGCVPTETSEPGDDIHAPYYHEHQAATVCEKLLAQELGVGWEEYEAAVGKLGKSPTANG